MSYRDIPKIELHCHLEACFRPATVMDIASVAKHPIRRLMEAGTVVTINSDEPSLFGIDLCHEYAVLEREHGFTREEFDRCNAIAAEHSFLAAGDVARVWPRAA